MLVSRGKRNSKTPGIKLRFPMNSSAVRFRTELVNGFKIFYREAGDPQKPAVLLLHGFPTSSHMFRNLVPQLADDFHVIAPDLPGFGFSDAPDHKTFAYTFDNVAKVIGDFVEQIGLKKFAVYVFDYGAPTSPCASLSVSRLSFHRTATPTSTA